MVAHGHRAKATRVKKRRGGGGSLVRFWRAEGSEGVAVAWNGGMGWVMDT